MEILVKNSPCRKVLSRGIEIHLLDVKTTNPDRFGWRTISGCHCQGHIYRAVKEAGVTSGFPMLQCKPIADSDMFILMFPRGLGQGRWRSITPDAHNGPFRKLSGPSWTNLAWLDEMSNSDFQFWHISWDHHLPSDEALSLLLRFCFFYPFLLFRKGSRSSM